MQEFKINYEQSYSLFKKYEARMQQRMCYHNIFKIVGLEQARFCENGWKVAYGYMTLFGQLICRHCFILNEKNEVIDPTVFTATGSQKENCEKTKYFVIKIYDNVEDYINAVKRNNDRPFLLYLFKSREKLLHNWFEKNNYIILG